MAVLGFSTQVMKHNLFFALAMFTLFLGTAQAAPTFELNGTTYTLTKADGDAFTFAPEGEAAETVALIYAPEAQAKDPLRSFTDGLRDELKAKGQVQKANIARNESGATIGYLIVGYFQDGDALVARMLRTMTALDGDQSVSVAVVYEHRFTGTDPQKDMIAWFNAHGRATEQALLALKSVPSTGELAQKPE